MNKQKTVNGKLRTNEQKLTTNKRAYQPLAASMFLSASDATIFFFLFFSLHFEAVTTWGSHTRTVKLRYWEMNITRFTGPLREFVETKCFVHEYGNKSDLGMKKTHTNKKHDLFFDLSLIETKCCTYLIQMPVEFKGDFWNSQTDTKSSLIKIRI